MTDNAMILHENGNGGALTAYHSRDDVRELGDRLMAMHPAAADVGASTMRAAAQLAILLGANPLPGVNEVHIWKDNKGRPCMSLGINYWRRKAQEWGGILFEVQPRPMSSKERAEYSIPDGSPAAICRGVRTADMLKFKSIGFTTVEVWAMCGRTGIGTQGPQEYAKSGRPNIWTSLKRAETDLLRQLFPAEFSSVERQTLEGDAPLVTVIEGDNVEGDATVEASAAEKRPYTVDDLNRDFGFIDDEIEIEQPEDGQWDDEAKTQDEESETVEEQPVDTPTAADFVKHALTLPGPQNVDFKADRLTGWVEFVTDGNYDPQHDELLLAVLDDYCSAIADNGRHTKKAAQKAQAAYIENITAAKAAAATQDDLFGEEYEERQAIVKAKLETAKGQKG